MPTAPYELSLWVPNIRSCALTRHDALASWEPMCRILYRLLVSLARLAVHSGRSKVLEIIVLRHLLGRLACAVSRVCASNAARMVRSVDVESAPAGPCRGWFVDCGGAVAAAVI